MLVSVGLRVTPSRVLPPSSVATRPAGSGTGEGESELRAPVSTQTSIRNHKGMGIIYDTTQAMGLLGPPRPD